MEILGKRKRNRETAFSLFSRAVREDMRRKFEGDEGSSRYAKHYQCPEVSVLMLYLVPIILFCIAGWRDFTGNVQLLVIDAAKGH